MASNTLIPEGHNCNFVEDPPDYLNCLICLSVTRDPQQHGDCGKLFCKSCITEYKKTSNVCPHCRHNLVTFNDGRSALEVKSLRVKCDSLDNGCLWVGELRSLEGHILACEYALIPCTNQCKKDGKAIKLMRKELPSHLIKCPRRKHPCQYCGEVGEYEERTSSHLDSCPRFQISCPNRCGEMIAHCEETVHRSKCRYEMVSCKYEDIGCKTTQHRKDIEKHEQDSQLHLEMVMKTVLDLKKRDVKVKSPVLTSQAKLVFTLNDYKKNKESQGYFFSTGFYTHPRGYKMCTGIVANGNNSGNGTHVSAYAYIMKGDNDDSLTWPFTGTVTVELLNQLEDKNHHTHIIGPFPEGSSGRVVEGERGAGWGYHQFIPHIELGYNSRKNCQYLENNTLVFRVSCNIPNRKPWLEETPTE